MAAAAAIVLFVTPVFAAAPITSVESERRGTTSSVPAQVPAQISSQGSASAQSSASDSSVTLQAFPQPQAVQAIERPMSTNVVAELQMLVTSLQEEVRHLRGQVEEHEFRLNQMMERQRELYRDIDRRLSAAPATPAGGVTAPVAEPVVDNKPVVSVSPETEQKEYDAAFALARGKKFAEAEKAFKEFLTRHPRSKNAGNARYWLGQVFVLQSQPEEAETQYKLVITQHPESPRASDALLKLGEIEKGRGNTEQARSYWQKLIQQYGESSSAQAARQRLQELGR